MSVVVSEEGELANQYIGCSSIDNYKIEDRLGQGTFGEVLLGTSKGSKVALKRIITHNENEGLSITTIREIKLLKRFKHENIVELLEIAVKKGDYSTRQELYMVFPYMDHDLSGILSNPQITLEPRHIKSYMQQLLKGIEHLHSKNIIHRDMKCANILVNNDGCVKLADFGLAREIDVKMTTVY